MVKTDYICDRCKAVQATKDQFWAVRVTVRPVDCSPGWSDSTREGQWCQKCTEEMGLLPTRKPSPPVVEPTLEEVIREIIREEVATAESNR